MFGFSDCGLPPALFPWLKAANIIAFPGKQLTRNGVWLWQAVGIRAV